MDFSARSMICTLTALAMISGATPARACGDNRGEDQAPWDAAVERDAAGKVLRRFVPPELYGGASWNGDRALELRAMRETRKPSTPSDHPPITVEGPMPWPGDGATQVIRRTRTSGRQGTITQYFRVNDRGDGLGRVEDQRATRSRPTMAECFKFPLGWWQAGETRTCGESTIRIIDLDFTSQGMAHALRFRWNDEGTYTFIPRCGMVSVTH